MYIFSLLNTVKNLQRSRKNVSNIPFVCFYLALLNFIDGILTYIGLRLNIIEEANILMNWIYDQNPIYFLIIKISLSLLLYMLVILKKIPEGKMVYMLTFFGAISYSIILFLHGLWLYVAFV
jgi:hypothetical protein